MIPLMEAKYRQCRWVLPTRGPDGLACFCGEKTVRGSYCEDHRRRVFSCEDTTNAR